MCASNDFQQYRSFNKGTYLVSQNIPLLDHFLQFAAMHAQTLPPLLLVASDHSLVQKLAYVYVLDSRRSEIKMNSSK